MKFLRLYVACKKKEMVLELMAIFWMSITEERSKLDQKGPKVITFKGQTDHFSAPLKGFSQTKAILFQDGFLFFIELSQ